jgi:hypothetical protein
MKKTTVFPVLALLLLLSCDKEQEATDEKSLVIPKIEGYIQKGPFLNGTSITVFELSETLVPTGKNFTTQITDNKGTFELSDVVLISRYVELEADGFYYNEVKDENASTRLILYALSDLSDKSSLNVNSLTHLERSRVKYLIASGMSFVEAKSQAQSEILSLFDIEKEDISTSEELDITKQGDDHAVLLAISVILQGNLSVSELSELLANISTDMREDGTLDSQTLGSTLINNARSIRPEAVRQNLESRYEALGLTVSIADFEKYVNDFIEHTDFVFTNYIEYPASGSHGLNILDKEKTEYNAGNYSMKAVLPDGTSLKVKISGNNWAFPAFQENTGWERSDWNSVEQSRVFTAVRTGEIDFKILLQYRQNPDSSSIENDTTNTSNNVYSNKINLSVYENDDAEPTWNKEITVKE